MQGRNSYRCFLMFPFLLLPFLLPPSSFSPPPSPSLGLYRYGFLYGPGWSRTKCSSSQITGMHTGPNSPFWLGVSGMELTMCSNDICGVLYNTQKHKPLLYIYFITLLWLILRTLTQILTSSTLILTLQMDEWMDIQKNR